MKRHHPGPSIVHTRDLYKGEEYTGAYEGNTKVGDIDNPKTN